MPISPEDAGIEVQRFIVGLNAPKHSAREKAIRSFKAFVDKQGMEFYDDDVDTLLLGDGYTLGLMQWCGESSTGTQGALKRTAAPAIALLKWLVSLRDPSGDENIFLGRFLQVALEDVRKMKLELHLLMSQKRSKVSSRGGKSEEACEIVSLVLQQHRNDAGEAEEISLDEVLPGDEAGKVFMSWLQRTAMGKQNTLRLSAGSDEGDTEQDIGEDGLRADGSGEGDDAMGGASEERLARYNDEDIPLTWAEVDQEQFIVFDKRVTAVVPGDSAAKIDEPVADPLGLKEVDLRIYQKTLVEDDTSAVVEVDGADGEASVTLQAKKRALLGQKDRLRLLKKMQSGKDRVQRKMDRGRTGDKTVSVDSDVDMSKADPKPAAQDVSRSVVPTTENFDPALFMTVLHATASFNDIRNGLNSLEGAKANQASELQRLVRDHFDSFVRCADSIEKYASHINMELTNNKEQPKEVPASRPTSLAQLRMQLKAEREAEGKLTHSARGGGDSWTGSGPAAKSHLKELMRLMEGARTEAGKNFSQLLQKLENIKQVRAAQHLLSEKGSILDIPREMSACMADGRYTELVKLYRKAHTTYSSSILSQVRVEAEAVGKRACARLMEVLRSPDVTLQEQIDAVGYLQDLQHDGDEPLQACFDSQKENFLLNATECRDAMEALLMEAYACRRVSEKTESARDQRNIRAHVRDRSSSTSRSDARRTLAMVSPTTPILERIGSVSEDMTDSEDFSPAGSLTGGASGGRFFDFREDQVLLAMDGSEDEALYDTQLMLDGEGRSDAAAVRVRAGIRELDGMELDEDLALAMPSGVDVLTHRVSVARLQHVSNVTWCLGSWLLHLVSLAVLLIRLEHSKNARGAEEGGVGPSSPQVHIRKLCGPGAFGGGTSDYAEGDTASVETSGPRASTSVQEGTSTRGSEESFATGRRDRVGTKAEKELTKLFERWLNSTTSVLRAAIFGGESASDQGLAAKNGHAHAGLTGRKPSNSMSQASPTGGGRDADSSLFAAIKHGSFSKAHAHESNHLQEPLDPRYLRQAFSSLAHLYDSLSRALGGSWEGDVVLTPGLRALEKLVKEAQALHVRSEMAALATEARSLMGEESWLPPESPHPPGGTRLPHMFGALAHQRMVNLVDLLPRAEWSAAEITHGLSDAVQCLLSCVTALGTHAYEASQEGGGCAPAAGTGAGQAGVSEGELSADYQLLCQIGNCLQLDTVILPELWDDAVEMFDASRAGVISDRKRTQKVQEKVMNKYLKRKYRELKMYVKNGWWGYAKPSAALGQAESSQCLNSGGRFRNEREHRNLSTTITRQRASLRIKRGTHFMYSGGGSADTAASVARQASMLLSTSEGSAKSVSKAQDNTRRGSMVNHRNGLKAALNIPIRAPKPQSLPSYLVKVLLSLVQARLEAQEALCCLLFRKAGMHDGKMRKDILYSDFVLRESARQVMEIVCDCANARVVGKGHLGAKVLDGSDPVEQAEKIAQAEFLRDALYRFLPSATLDRVNRVIKRLQAGKFEGTLGRSTAGIAPSTRQDTKEVSSARDGLMRVGPARGSTAADQNPTVDSGKGNTRTSVSATGGGTAKATFVSDSLGAAMPGSFLTATDLQELARVYVVCLK